MTLVLEGLVLQKTRRPSLTAELTPGTHAFLCNSEQEERALLAILSGESPPRRGRVLLAGKPLLSSPRLRAQLSCLPASRDFDELGTTARDHLRRARQIRERAGVSCRDVPQFLSSTTIEKPLSRLTREERRLLQLEVALAPRNPRLRLFPLPLSGLSDDVVDQVLALTARSAQDEVVSIVVARQAHQLHPYADTIVGAGSVSPEHRVTISLRVERPRELAALAQSLPDVLTTELDPQRPDFLQITGTSTTDLPAALSRLVVECKCALLEMSIHAGGHFKSSVSNIVPNAKATDRSPPSAESQEHS